MNTSERGDCHCYRAEYSDKKSEKRADGDVRHESDVIAAVKCAHRNKHGADDTGENERVHGSADENVPASVGEQQSHRRREHDVAATETSARCGADDRVDSEECNRAREPAQQLFRVPVPQCVDDDQRHTAHDHEARHVARYAVRVRVDDRKSEQPREHGDCRKREEAARGFAVQQQRADAGPRADRRGLRGSDVQALLADPMQVALGGLDHPETADKAENRCDVLRGYS